MILVTGRILHELHGAFPDVEDHVDAIVAENGCVLWTQRGTRLLADPVGPELATASPREASTSGLETYCSPEAPTTDESS